MTTDGCRQINVLALIDHFILGGAETMLARFAAAAPRAGIRLSIACLDERDGNPAATPLIALGNPPVNLNLVGRPGPNTLRILRRHIRATRAQIVHTHLGTSDLIGSFAARTMGVPAVSTVHTTQWPGGSAPLRLAVRQCTDRIITVSRSAAEEYRHRGWAREGQIVIIYNGIDAQPAPGAGPEVRRELGLRPEDQVILMLSALRPEKGHDVAIDAVDSLRRHDPRVKLVIVGQGPLQDQLARRASQLDGAVVMAGRRDDVMRVLDAADLCLHPSHHDALPTTLIEAMAASVPIIATAVGGIPEMVTDGREGVLLDAPPSPEAVTGAAVTLLNDAPRRRAMGAAGLLRYRACFTVDPWVMRTRGLYDEVLREHSGRLRRRQVHRPKGSPTAHG